MKPCVVLLALLLFSTDIWRSFGDEEVNKKDPSHEIAHEKNAPLNESSTAKSTDSKLLTDPSKNDMVKKGEKQDAVAEGGNKNDPGTGSLNQDLNSKVVPKEGAVKESKDDSNKEPIVKKRGEEKDGSNGESKSKSKLVDNDKNSIASKESKPLREDSTRVEECGASSNCTDKKNNLIACLRVPGNESPDLSLFIQNKGTNPLMVKILAPDFVNLEKSTVHLQGKEDKKVKVSFGKAIGDTTLTLKAGDGNCTIDFRDLISHYSDREVSYSTKYSFTGILTKSPKVLSIYMLVAVVLLVTPAWMCVKYWRKHIKADDGSRYQKLETELPILSKGNTEPDPNEGWENSWGDSWDDEEAPKTPSKPVTPSISSKRAASRRHSKDGWKD
ncbi:hypothetical protein Sjap_005312 [Stephania japonica]|uniref:DUF7356 domain-containing protein n=1 Tax=Stephania japonica TaxID=461633 RepID=A0AAP0K595_9MAGN